MTINGRSARLLRRYGPWTLVVTAATVAAAYGANQATSADYRSEATVLVEARIAADAIPVRPDIETERALALSDAVVVPAAQRIGVSEGVMLDGFEIDVVPGADVLTFVYSADDRFSAQVRTRALVEAYLDYRKTGTVATPTVISPANLPDEPNGRPLVPDLGIGLGVGLLLGAGTAVLRSLTRGKIRDRGDFERLSGATVLATVPRARRPAGTSTGLPVVLRDPNSPAAESYRYLRTRLQPVLRPTSATTILVTSPGDREGRSTVAANLAVALAQAGRSVVLVDADLRRPVLHTVFQLSGEYGLTTLLDGDATVSEVLEDTAVPRLRLLPAGQRTGEHVDLLESPQLARVLRAVQKHCDVVVLDSAAVLSASDAIALAALSDQVLLVGDFRRTTRESVERAMDELDEVVDGNVSGVLLNLPKFAGGLAPRTRELATTPVYGRTNSRLKADAEDVRPPGITSHVYIEAEEDDEPEEAQEQEQQPGIAVPVIYGAQVTPTVYSSSSAALTEPTATQPLIEDPAASQPAASQLAEPVPFQPPLSEPEPSESVPFEPTLSEPEPSHPAPSEPEPSHPAPSEPAPSLPVAEQPEIEEPEIEEPAAVFHEPHDEETVIHEPAAAESEGEATVIHDLAAMDDEDKDDDTARAAESVEARS